MKKAEIYIIVFSCTLIAYRLNADGSAPIALINHIQKPLQNIVCTVNGAITAAKNTLHILQSLKPLPKKINPDS